MKSLTKKPINSSRIFGLALGLWGLIFSNLVFLQAQSRQALFVEASVPPIQSLSIENTKPFPPISARHFDRDNIEVEDAVTLSISSNVPWRLVASSPQTNLYVSSKRFKSIEQLQWRLGSDSYRPFSGKPFVISSGEGGVRDYKVSLDYRLNLGWRDTPPGRWEFNPEFRIEPNY